MFAYRLFLLLLLGRLIGVVAGGLGLGLALANQGSQVDWSVFVIVLV